MLGTRGSVRSIALIFLQALPSAFPETTAVFLEGSSIAADIVQIFEQHIDAGSYLPEPQTLWSRVRSSGSVCRFTSSLFEALASASQHHAEPELFDHIFLYADRQAVLEWPDAFANCMWIGHSVSETRVSAFATKLGLSYKYCKSRLTARL